MIRLQSQKTQQPSEKPKFIKHQFVIFHDPQHPIYFIESFLRFISPYFHVFVSTHIHSTVMNLSNELANFGSLYSSKNTNVDIFLTIIWKTIGFDPIMVLPGMHKIQGVVNIARYLNRLVEQVDPNLLKYEANDPLYASKIDFYLDKIHCYLHNTDTNRSLTICEKLRYIMGKDISIIDLILEHINKYEMKKKS